MYDIAANTTYISVYENDTNRYLLILKNGERISLGPNLIQSNEHIIPCMTVLKQTYNGMIQIVTSVSFNTAKKHVRSLYISQIDRILDIGGNTVVKF